MQGGHTVTEGPVTVFRPGGGRHGWKQGAQTVPDGNAPDVQTDEHVHSSQTIYRAGLTCWHGHAVNVVTEQ